MSHEAKPEKPAAKPKAKRTKPAASSPIAVDDGIRRRAGRRLGGRVGSVLVLAIVLMANYLAFRHYHRWDWTQDGLFTLSQRSVGVARALEAPLDIYLFLGASEPQHDEIRELLERYRAESAQVRLHEVDPDRQQAEYRVLADRFNLMQGQASDVAVLVKQGEHTWKITRDDLRDVDMSSIGDASGPTLDVKSEQALTGAILQVTEGRPTKLCLTAGHGEWALGGAGDRDCSAVRDELRRDNVEVETIATIDLRSVPDGCDALWVVGPSNAFSDREVQLVSDYVDGGGNLLLALDPVLRDQHVQPTGFESLLRGWGVQVDPSLVLERDRNHRLTESPMAMFLVNDFGSADTMARMTAAGSPVVLHIARSVRPMDGETGVEPFLRGTDQSFAAVDLEPLATEAEPEPGPEDVTGPISAGVLLTRTPTAHAGDEASGDASSLGGRVAVIGDADFLQPQLLHEPQFANIDLLGALTGWLTQRQELISIAPRHRNIRSVVMSEGDLTGVLIRVLVLVPLALGLLGFAVWWSRRQ